MSTSYVLKIKKKSETILGFALSIHKSMNMCLGCNELHVCKLFGLFILLLVPGVGEGLKMSWSALIFSPTTVLQIFLIP